MIHAIFGTVVVFLSAICSAAAFKMKQPIDLNRVNDKLYCRNMKPSALASEGLQAHGLPPCSNPYFSSYSDSKTGIVESLNL